MSARLLVLLVLPLALCGPAPAAPAPLRRAGADQPEGVLRGFLPDPRLAPGAPSGIVRPEAYRSVAKAYGIADPPRVNFRTHFLFVHVWPRGDVRCVIDGGGDLRAVIDGGGLLFGLHRDGLPCACGLEVAG